MHNKNKDTNYNHTIGQTETAQTTTKQQIKGIYIVIKKQTHTNKHYKTNTTAQAKYNNNNKTPFCLFHFFTYRITSTCAKTKETNSIHNQKQQ